MKKAHTPLLICIAAFLLTLLLIIGFSSCSKIKEFEPTESEIGGLVAISYQKEFIDGYNYDQIILYDPETLVMYSIISGGDDTTITVLYNADGTPKLYNPVNG